MNTTPPQSVENVSTFPPPPPFYKLYLNYKKGDNSTDSSSTTGLKPLEPPLPPKDGTHYTQFGQTYSTVDILPSLEELGKTQLYPQGDIEPIKELKKLNRSILFNYLQLLETLIENPTDYRSKVEDISLLFINFHHLLNSYRPHEARETLTNIMIEQIKQKKNTSDQLKQTLETSKQLLLNFFKEINQEPDAKLLGILSKQQLQQHHGQTPDQPHTDTISTLYINDQEKQFQQQISDMFNELALIPKPMDL
ncbi:putative mediator complex subunit 7 [Tieghemostelium lacteum]|uniref:Mediator of RNA polymerase II transcription subunit 7 n=1 Tax=Tieghemostelium lacteum TaxID=361077 RepID=A0A151ZS90_TIELA|nr:putative mediator complex subunit 7 [Tieghemostelium lacteum]|eukprot:KYQ96816.1 putative mediator complex subunit 7 [Tieghemostelium lacteum]